MCKHELRKINTYQKYGVKHTSMLNSTKEKVKKTNLERFDKEFYSQTKEYKINGKNWGFLMKNKGKIKSGPKNG